MRASRPVEALAYVPPSSRRQPSHLASPTRDLWLCVPGSRRVCLFRLWFRRGIGATLGACERTSTVLDAQATAGAPDTARYASARRLTPSSIWSLVTPE